MMHEFLGSATALCATQLFGFILDSIQSFY